MNMQHPDQIYVEALLVNDPSLVEVIYKNYSAKIVHLIRSMGGSSDDGWDIFQDGLLAITMRARKHKLELNCPFEAYLLIVCKRKWLNYLSLKGRKTGTDTVYPGSVHIEGMEALEKPVNTLLFEFEMHQLIRKHINNLNHLCRDLLDMVLKDFSLTEISESLKKTYNSTKKSKWECEQKLIKLIRNSPDYGELKILNAEN